MKKQIVFDSHFAPIWELLLKEFNQIATYHSEMAHKITQEIEKPLRASPSNDYEKLHQVRFFIIDRVF